MNINEVKPHKRDPEIRHKHSQRHYWTKRAREFGYGEAEISAIRTEEMAAKLRGKRKAKITSGKWK